MASTTRVSGARQASGAGARGAFRTHVQDTRGRPFLAAVFGELVGTYLLMFLGTGAVVGFKIAAGKGDPNLLAIALAWGFAVLAVVYAFGHVSGGHVNPAVTIGLAVTKKFPLKAVGPYIAAQLVGGVLASLTVLGLFGAKGKADPILLGGTAPGDGYTATTAFFAEVVITFLLLLVVMATATDDRAESPAVGLGVGLTIAAGILVVGPISGSSFNPARSLAPMIVTGSFSDALVYIAGPIVGGTVGALHYEHLLRPGAPPESEGALDEHTTGEPESVG